ncbi:MAG TPA: aldehyde dehydrogenase family protein [Candidatus Polarisedimenticolaceae bacterium]
MEALIAARAAQAGWNALSPDARVATLGRARVLLAGRLEALERALGRPDPVESLTAEILPLLAAIRFLEREAPRALAPRRLGSHGRPAWLPGVDAEIRREPVGVVLVIAPANYPLFLPGVHALQALAAGNAVLVKPAPGRSAAMRILAECLAQSGLDPALVAVLPEDPGSAHAAIDGGVDKVVLTGSSATGTSVLAALAPRAVPSVMELSGDDPVFVLDSADVALAESAIRFGLALNRGETCIAPRRVFVARRHEAALRDLPVPVVPFDGVETALAEAARSPCALGASIFGEEREARALAARVRAGYVAINDVIVTSADPRLPFGGRGASGFGTTRGIEGLLELTAVKAITTSRGPRRHLEARRPGDAALFRAWIAAGHGPGLATRMRGFLEFIRLAIARGR